MSEESGQKRGGGRASEAIRKRQQGLRRTAERGSPQSRSEAAGENLEGSPGNGGDQAPAGKPIRVTVDLPRGEHRALRVLAAESGATGMGVMRALLQEALDDQELAARVRERLADTT